MMQLESSANIYIHEVIIIDMDQVDILNIHTLQFEYFWTLCQPPLLLEDVSTEGLDADIHVEGDIIRWRHNIF